MYDGRDKYLYMFFFGFLQARNGSDKMFGNTSAREHGCLVRAGRHFYERHKHAKKQGGYTGSIMEQIRNSQESSCYPNSC